MWCWCAFPTHPSIPRRRRSRHLCCFESKQMSRPTSFWPSWTKLKTASEIQSWGKPFSVLSRRSPIFSDLIIFTICTIKIPSSRRPCFSRNPPLIQYKSVKNEACHMCLSKQKQVTKECWYKKWMKKLDEKQLKIWSGFIGFHWRYGTRTGTKLNPPVVLLCVLIFVRFSLQRLLSPL